jgi:hypothetical protein
MKIRSVGLLIISIAALSAVALFAADATESTATIVNVGSSTVAKRILINSNISVEIRLSPGDSICIRGLGPPAKTLLEAHSTNGVSRVRGLHTYAAVSSTEATAVGVWTEDQDKPTVLKSGNNCFMLDVKSLAFIEVRQTKQMH